MGTRRHCGVGISQHALGSDAWAHSGGNNWGKHLEGLGARLGALGVYWDTVGQGQSSIGSTGMSPGLFWEHWGVSRALLEALGYPQDCTLGVLGGGLPNRRWSTGGGCPGLPPVPEPEVPPRGYKQRAPALPWRCR